MNCYSFDVFDTCLCRLCGEPRMLFDVLSLKVQQAMGENCNEHTRQRFVASRVNAGGRDLEEIYRRVSESFPIPCSVERMAELEMETEREMLAPIVATRKLVDQLRAKGRVLYISDMYLPSEFIKERLEEFGFFKEGDSLFVSEELQAWKNDGSLFRLVHEREHIPYRQWHHYGDCRNSDYKVPKKMGIRAHHLHYDYLFCEEQWIHQPTVGYQYPSILAGVSRAVRLQSEASEDQSRFVADISAPFVMSWVCSVLRDAQKRGVRRLFFLARDVHSEYLVAKRLCRFFPELEVRYLFVSSKGLYESDLVDAYLDSEGLFAPVPSAIVDSCSSGRTLAEINNIVAAHGGSPLHGYFVAKLQTEKSPTVDTGDYVLTTNYLLSVTPQSVSRVLGMRIFFELLFSLNYHHTVVGYEYHGPRIRPMLCKDDIDEWRFDDMTSRKAKRDSDRMLLSFADAFALTGLACQSETLLERLVLPTLIDFVDRPEKEYLGYLHHFVWGDKVFVGRLRGPRKGVWKRADRAWVLPSWMIHGYYSLISNRRFRKKLNQLVLWMPFLKTVR